MTEGTTPPDVNASGTLTFRAQARRPDNTLFQGIWSGDSSSLNLIAYTGQVAPGTLPGVFFISFIGAPFNNDAGHTTFKARLQGVGIDDTNESGIWSDASGGLYPVALAGQLAPGTSGGIVFDGFVQDPKFNNLGQVAFRGRLAGPQVRPENADGFWIKTASGLQLIARAGDAAPGVEPGIRFGRFAQFSHPVLNNEGSLAFHANLSGGGNDEGLWAGRPGDMRLLLRTGDVLDVDDTDAVDLRIIESLHIKDAGLGGTAFNDLGQLAFSAQFTDGSWGVFVMNTGLVPEPSSLATLSVILLCGVYFARRRSMARSRIWSENQAPARTTTRQLRS